MRASTTRTGVIAAPGEGNGVELVEGGFSCEVIGGRGKGLARVIGRNDVVMAVAPTDDRAVLALNGHIAIGVSRSRPGKFSDAKGFEEFGDGAADVDPGTCASDDVEREPEIHYGQYQALKFRLSRSARKDARVS